MKRFIIAALLLIFMSFSIMAENTGNVSFSASEIKSNNDIPEEDRIDIAGNLKGKSNTVSTLKKGTVKREKYFEDEIKKENIKNVSEEDSIDIINNLSFNRL